LSEDDDTQIIRVAIEEGTQEGTLWYDDQEWKLKEWKDGQWRTLKFKYEGKKYIDPSLVTWGCGILIALLVLGLGILVGWIIL